MRRILKFLLLLGSLHGCIRTDHVISRPTIRDYSGWKMIENCGYEHCDPLVDFLTTEDVSIRIESLNDAPRTIFVIRVLFIPKNRNEVAFNPSVVSVKRADGRTLAAKGLPCRTIFDISHLRSARPITGPVQIDKLDCFYLFFDSPPPSVEEEFTLKLAGVIRKGQALEVPDIIFRKGISRW